MTDDPTRRDLLRDLTREAVDAGTYSEPAPEMATVPTINRELMVAGLGDRIAEAIRQAAHACEYGCDCDGAPVVEAETGALTHLLRKTEDELHEVRTRAEKAERRAEHFEEHAAQINADLGIETQRAEKAEAAVQRARGNLTKLAELCDLQIGHATCRGDEPREREWQVIADNVRKTLATLDQPEATL